MDNCGTVVHTPYLAHIWLLVPSPGQQLRLAKLCGWQGKSVSRDDLRGRNLPGPQWGGEG